MNRWLVVMAKEPRAGAVKTRLAKDIGLVSATAFYRKALANLLQRISNDPRWNTLVAVTPDTSLLSPVWPGGVSLTLQGRGDLGARMQRMFDDLPPGPVVIIGTDIPEIAPQHIASAFNALGNSDAVIGPGYDGGYWLVGQRRTPKVHSIFDNVRWSSPHTLADTLKNIHSLSVATRVALDVAINLDVPVEVVTERMLARQREDDTPEAIERRLSLYEEQTAPLLDWFGSRDLLATVDGVGSEEEVFARLAGVIDQARQ